MSFLNDSEQGDVKSCSNNKDVILLHLVLLLTVLKCCNVYSIHFQQLQVKTYKINIMVPCKDIGS